MYTFFSTHGFSVVKSVLFIGHLRVHDRNRYKRRLPETQRLSQKTVEDWIYRTAHKAIIELISWCGKTLSDLDMHNGIHNIGFCFLKVFSAIAFCGTP